MTMPARVNVKQKIFRWLLRSAIAICAFFVLILALIYVFLQRDPDALIKSYLEPLARQTGLQFTIGSVDVTLLPLPAMSISDLSISGAELEFSAAWASARPSFTRILSGDFLPGSITILRPKLHLTTDLALNDPESIAEKLKQLAGGVETEVNARLPGDFDVEIKQFNAEITGANETQLILSSFQCVLNIWQNGNVSGIAEIASLRLMEGASTLASLENFHMNGRSSFKNFFSETHGLKVGGEARLRNVVRSSQFGLEFESSSLGWNGSARLTAALAVGGVSVPLNLAGKIARPAHGDEISLHGLEWQLGADSGSLELIATLPINMTDFRLKGAFFANRASLTQWLGFARNLCPGLQISLDNITRCRLQFAIDKTGLEATNIVASCAGSTFTGKGGIPDWSKPVVELSMHTPLANLGVGLPESVAQVPDAPWFPHPTLTPLPDEPLKPGETGIGYDIRLSADTTIYGPVKFQNASVRIHPGKLDQNGFKDVLLDTNAKFYGGNVNGSCILGADPSLPYYITVKATDINGAPLSKAMPVLPFRQGVFDASATVTSKGKKLDVFLANLKGDIKANGENATLAATGAKTVYASLAASSRLRQAAWNGKQLSFNGQWRASLAMKDLSASCDASGNLNFGRGGMSFKNLAGTLELKTGARPLPENTQIKLTGNFSGTPDQGKFEASRASLELLGQTIRGDISVDTNKKPPLFQGSISTEFANLNSSLARFGVKHAGIPEAFNQLKLKADISGSSDNLKFTKINARLGHTGISGNLRWQERNQRHFFESELVLDRLDLTPFFMDSKSGASSWDFKALTSFDVNGSLRIKELLAWDLRFANVHAPARLENGRLSSGQITANFYGAPLKCNVNADFQKGLSFGANVQANAFNLSEAAKARKIETILTGSASMDAKLGAKLSANMKLAPALNGQWTFSVANGSWQGTNKNGKPQGKPASFKLVKASGTIINGMVRSDNFSLVGNGLNVTGKGSLNLANQDVNCNFNVDMKGLPDFPLRLYGPLANTKTSIGAGKMALNAVGEVVSGFTGAVGGVLKGAWNIFSK